MKKPKPVPTPVRRILVVAYLFFSLTCYSQNGGLMRTDLIAPSPTAANLGKYGEIPVTYYTGLPNVTIPIFTVTGNELSLPITLSYNFNGHQPTQKASSVGLGWTLQAGGVITRTIGDKIDPPNGYDRATANNVNPTDEYLRNSYEFNMYDNLPDIYSFNFGNYSGKFILFDGIPYLIPDQKLKITRAGSNGFQIVTEDGTKYLFDDVEMTLPRISEGSPYQLPPHPSAWYLTRITNATGTESISFNYTSDGRVLQYGMRSQTYNEIRQSTGYPQYQVQPTNTPGPIGDVFPTRVDMLRLTSIVSDKYAVTFAGGSTQREDIETESGITKELSSIFVYASDGAMVKRFDLEHDYFGSGGVSYKYLKLKSITDRGAGTAETVFAKHEFEYYNEESGFGTGTLSYVDVFGYLIGGGYMPGNMYISNKIYPYGTNRDPVFDGMVTGTLKKISYPTGGSSVFTYEQNRALKDYSYVSYPDNVLAQSDRGNPATTNLIYSTNTFVITQPQQVKVRFGRTPKIPWDPSTGPAEVEHDNVAEVELAQVTVVEGEPETVGPAFWSGKIIFNANNGGLEQMVTLEPGKYRVRSICDHRELQAFGVVEYTVHTDTPNPGIDAPGIRLKAVTTENGYGKSMTKQYSYVDDLGFSTGVLLGSNWYSAREWTDVFHSTQVLADVWWNVYLSHTSMLAESPGLGLPFYYRRVREEAVNTSDPTDIHRTDYTFDYFANTKAVEMIEKVDYKKVGSSFVPHARQENTFSIDYPGEAFGGMSVFVNGRRTTYEAQWTTENLYGFELRLEYVSWKYPVLTRNTTYENGQALVTESKSFYDANANRNRVGMRTTTSDGRSLYTKYKYPEDYANFVTAASHLKSLHILSAVIEEQVWMKKDPVANPNDSVMINGKINVYQNGRIKEIYVFESVDGINQPDNETPPGQGSYQTLISDSRYKKKIEFTYDASGRVKSQQLTDHAPVSYLWGYDMIFTSGSPAGSKIFPIAEIKNASAAQVFHTSFEDATGTIMTSVTGKKAKGGAFTIPGSFTGNYTLTYWQKSGNGNWTLVSNTLTDPAGIVIGDSNSTIDEVRLYPSSAVMTTYTYDPRYGISSVNDANNVVSYFDYDKMGRLSVMKDKAGYILKTYQYHIKDQVDPIEPGVE
jgi:hypothetical protein